MRTKLYWNLDEPDWLSEGCRGMRAWAIDAPNGKKQYFSASERGVQRLLLRTPRADRNIFEILSTPVCRSGTAGVLAACRPYLDAEFDRVGYSTTLTDLEITQRLVREFIRTTRACISVQCTRVKAYIMESSNTTKYSIHIVLHMFDREGNEIRIKNCMHVGAIVRHWELGSRDSSDLYWTDKHGATVFIPDIGVYTIRRQIRLVQNTKKGQERWLVPIDLETGAEIELDATTWSNYLIQDHSAGTSQQWDAARNVVVAVVTEPDGSSPRATSAVWGPKVERRETAEQRLDKFERTQHQKRYGNAPAKRPATLAEHNEQAAKRQRVPRQPRTPNDGRRTLEQACVGWVARHTSNPSAYSVRRDGPACTIATVGSHECRIRGNPHASNHIYFVANLRYKSVSQKCHDGQCEGKRAIQELTPELNQHMRIATQFSAAIKQFFM